MGATRPVSLETYYNNFSAQFDKMNACDHNFHAMQEMAGLIQMLHLRIFANFVTISIVHVLRENIKANVLDIKDTYCRKSKIAMTAAVITFSLAVAFCALSPLTGNSIVSSSTAETLSKNSQSLAPAVQAAEGVNGLLDQKATSERTGYEHEKTTNSAEKELATQFVQQQEQRASALLHADDKLKDAHHQAFSQMRDQ